MVIYLFGGWVSAQVGMAGQLFGQSPTLAGLVLQLWYVPSSDLVRELRTVSLPCTLDTGQMAV